MMSGELDIEKGRTDQVSSIRRMMQGEEGREVRISGREWGFEMDETRANPGIG
jgi:hypothetical protein